MTNPNCRDCGKKLIRTSKFERRYLDDIFYCKSCGYWEKVELTRDVDAWGNLKRI